MQKFATLGTIALGAVLHLAPASVTAQEWTQWTSADAGNVFGTLDGIDVTYTGARNGVQFFDGTGTMSTFDYFGSPSSPYTQNGLTAPPRGFVQINAAVQNVTITFAEAVINPYLAFISVGRSSVPITYDFAAGTPTFDVLSNNNTGSGNCGYWGCGSYTITASSLTGRELCGTL